jgi:hypothetical protein
MTDREGSPGAKKFTWLPPDEESSEQVKAASEALAPPEPAASLHAAPGVGSPLVRAPISLEEKPTAPPPPPWARAAAQSPAPPGAPSAFAPDGAGFPPAPQPPIPGAFPAPPGGLDVIESRPIYVDKRMVVGGLMAVFLFFVTVLMIRAVQGNRSPEAYSLKVRAGEIKKNMAGTWTRLDVPSSIQEDTTIKTGRNDHNVLELQGGGTIRLDRGTSLQVGDIEQRRGKQRVTLHLYTGRIWVQGAAGDEVVVDTPLVRVSPLGTVYTVSQGEQQDLTDVTVVTVYSGSVEVTHKEDKEARVTVVAAQTVTATNSKLQEPRMASTQVDEWIQWNMKWTAADEMPREKVSVSDDETPAPRATRTGRRQQPGGGVGSVQPGGGQQFGPPGQGGNQQFGPPGQGGNQQFGPPGQGGNQQFGPPGQGGNQQFGPPGQGGNQQFGPPGQGGNQQFGPPGQGGNQQFGPPGGNQQYGPPQQGQGRQGPRQSGNQPLPPDIGTGQQGGFQPGNQPQIFQEQGGPQGGHQGPPQGGHQGPPQGGQQGPPQGGPQGGGHHSGGGSQADDDEETFEPSHPTPAPTVNTGPPGYAPGSQ